MWWCFFGGDIFTANNGIDAVKIAKAEKPSLLLLDLMLPGIDGFDVCKEIKRNNEIFKKLRIFRVDEAIFILASGVFCLRR